MLRVKFTHHRFSIHSLGLDGEMPTEYGNCEVAEAFGPRAISVRTNIYGSLGLKVSVKTETAEPELVIAALRSEGWEQVAIFPFEAPDGRLYVEDLGMYGYGEVVNLEASGNGTLVIAVRGRSEEERDDIPDEPREEFAVRFIPAGSAG